MWEPGKKNQLFQEMISVEQKWERQEGGELLLYSNDVLKIPKYVDSHKKEGEKTTTTSLSKMKGKFED